MMHEGRMWALAVVGISLGFVEVHKCYAGGRTGNTTVTECKERRHA
jgi:hypothetical protein